MYTGTAVKKLPRTQCWRNRSKPCCRRVNTHSSHGGRVKDKLFFSYLHSVVRRKKKKKGFSRVFSHVHTQMYIRGS